VVALPFVIAGVVPALRAVDPHVRESAAVLGATPLRALTAIEWPAARRAIVTGIGFSVAISLGEFGATSFVSRGDDSFTAPLAIFRLLSQPGETLRGQAMALSVIIGVVVAALAAALERLRGTRTGAL
jgi:thiamine transport system permease protein